MQQPDYNNNNNNTAPYNNYPYPNTNTNPIPTPSPQPTYASAPPYNNNNYPPTPQFLIIPDPTPSFTNYPHYTPPQPQPPLPLSPVYPQLDPYQPAPTFPHSGPYQYDGYVSPRVDPQQHGPNYDQFGPAQLDSGPSHTRYNDGTNAKYDQFGGGYGNSRADTRRTASMYPQTNPSDGNYVKYDQFGSSGNNGYGDGVYAYQGSKTEPYGSRGTGSWGGSGGSTRIDSGPSFDDFGRPIGSGKGSSGPAAAKVVRAVPKAESRQDTQGGVQKFRVKLLAESGGQTNQDVLCQIGLDGIRMLDPTTSRTLRIYPLDTVTRYEVLDSSIFAFWAKSSVDIEPRRIRLKSNSYTSSTILDIVTAATIQFKEIGGGRSRSSDSLKPAEQPPEKKKGLGDWMNIIKPGNEEKDHWVPDEAVAKCTSCGTDFSAFVRRHHCRNCGDIFCDKCTHGRIALTAEENAQAVRVCDRCLAEVTHRLNIAKESTNRLSAGLQSHEDFAKKLQEEMERNRRSSSGSRSDGSGKRMKEVACPTCTVHLQVQVPSSGSETIECGVCQHPFLVSSR